MRWFKHLTNSSDNEQFAELRAEFGAEGYGIFWIILEKIASQMNKKTNKDKSSAEYSIKSWANFCGISQQKFKKVSTFFQLSSNFSLLFFEKAKKNNIEMITIKCPKLLEYRDEYSSRKEKNREFIGSVSGQTPSQEYRVQSNRVKNKTSSYMSSPSKSGDDQMRRNPCLYEEIRKLYNKMMPELSECMVLSPAARANIHTRWVTDFKTLKHWKTYFNIVRQSDFLMGKITQHDRKPFRADLIWLVKPNNYAKVINRRYSDDK